MTGAVYDAFQPENQQNNGHVAELLSLESQGNY